MVVGCCYPHNVSIDLNDGREYEEYVQPINRFVPELLYLRNIIIFILFCEK